MQLSIHPIKIIIFLALTALSIASSTKLEEFTIHHLFKFSGKLSDWKSNTLTLYFNDYFIGDEEYMNNDVTHLSYPDKAKSLIVTGCLPWTVYADVNYRVC